MSVEEVNTMYEFMEKYGTYWEIVQEAAEQNAFSLDQWEFDSVVEEVGGISIRLYHPEYDETFAVDISTYDNSWEATLVVL
jgi:hypothetical protein